MEVNEKKQFLFERIKKYNATQIDHNKMLLCETDRELLMFFLQNDPSYWFSHYVITIEEFKDFFSEYFSDYRIYTEGEHKLYGHHTAYVFDVATVSLYNDMTAYAYNSSKVYAYQKSTVHAYDNVKVEARNNSTASIYGRNCEAEFRNESKGYVENGTAQSYDTAAVCIEEGTLTMHGQSTATSIQGGYKEILCYDQTKLVAKGSPSVCAMNNSYVEAHDLSDVTVTDTALVDAYDRSRITMNCMSRCNAFDMSNIRINGGKCLVMNGMATATNVSERGMMLTPRGASYLIDMTDTYVNVQNSATIKWYCSGKLFSNERALN